MPSDLDPTSVVPDASKWRAGRWNPDNWAWRTRARANPATRFWYRLGVGFLGLLLILSSGLVGWLPGPGGIPLLLAGLGVWSSEFAWARRLTRWLFAQGRRYLAWSRAAKARFWTAVSGFGMSVWYALAGLFGLPGWLPESVQSALASLPGI